MPRKKAEFTDNKLGCHPARETKDNTCFSLDELQIIAKKIKKSDKIYDDVFTDSVLNNKLKLWKTLYKYFQNRLKCQREFCWLDHPELKYIDELQNVFVPKHPKSWNKNKYAWLCNLDIDDVMEQYEEKYDDFLFLGPVPIDFDDIHTEIDYLELLSDDEYPILRGNTNKNVIKDGIKRVGIVFNTDPHDKPGAHWIAMFFDCRDRDNANTYYFDSYGRFPPDEVLRLMARIGAYCQNRKHIIYVDPYYNDVQHQRDDSECGVYCLHFLLRMLEADKDQDLNKFKEVINTVVDDETMNSYRKLLFRNE